MHQPPEVWASWGVRQELAKYIKELLEQKGYSLILWSMATDHYLPGTPEFAFEKAYITVDGSFCDHRYTWIYINAEASNPIQIVWGHYRMVYRTVTELDPANPNLFDQILELMPKRIPLWKIPYYRLIKKV